MNEFDEVLIFQEKLMDDLGLKEENKKCILENVEMAIKVKERSSDSFNVFFDIVLGMNSKFPNMTSMSFPQRFLKIVDIQDLGIERYNILDNILEKCFFLGFICHFSNWNMPTRANIENVNFDKLVEDWLPNTLVANIQMSEYAKENDGFANDYFNLFYNKQDFRKILKNNFNLGFLKLERTTSFFNNVFYCGAMYGMYYDMATKQEIM